MFNKRVDLLTFDDVVGFLEEGRREDVHLDYKQETVSGSKTAKLASAFANTDGGFIVFGVQESDRAPVPPFEGRDLGKNPVQTVQNACRDYLTPQVEPQFSPVLRNPSDTSKAFLVVAIPQSGMAPHVYRESKSEDEYVFIKAQDHKEPVHPTLARYEFLREKREACRGRADQIMACAQSELNKAWQAVWPAEVDAAGGRQFRQIPFVYVAVCRAYPEMDVLAVPQLTIERLDQYAVEVKYANFQRRLTWGPPLGVALPARSVEQLNTFDSGVLTNTTQQVQEVPLAAVMHSEGCFAGKVGVPLQLATPFDNNKPGSRLYVPAVLLCGLARGFVRSAFRWFQTFGCYASLRVNITISSDRLSHWIVRPGADSPARPNTHGAYQQGPTTGYVIDEKDFYGPSSVGLGGEWIVPWPCDAEASRIARDLTTRYVSTFNVKDSATVKTFADAVTTMGY